MSAARAQNGEQPLFENSQYQAMKNNITRSLIVSSKLDSFDNMELKNKTFVTDTQKPSTEGFANNTLYSNPTVEEINQSSANTFTTKKMNQQRI